MVQENPDSVQPSGVIPNTPNPDSGKGIPFAIEASKDVQVRMGIGTETETFNPVYYPDRYSDTMEKEVSKDSRQCGGEDVTIDTMSNPEFHATGIVLDGNVSNFRKIRAWDGPVNLITPLTDNDGGMEVIITKGKIGEIVGWDGVYKQWQFNYTLDMVATGDESVDNNDNQIVSEILESE